jgi:hypothetical protein
VKGFVGFGEEEDLRNALTTRYARSRASLGETAVVWWADLMSHLSSFQLQANLVEEPAVVPYPL